MIRAKLHLHIWEMILLKANITRDSHRETLGLASLSPAQGVTQYIWGVIQYIYLILIPPWIHTLFLQLYWFFSFVVNNCLFIITESEKGK